MGPWWLRLLRRLFLTREIVSRKGLLHFQRWRLLQTPWFAIYVHQIARSDEDPDPHDHPFAFRSFILKGGYTETVVNEFTRLHVKTYVAGQSVYHPTTDCHRIRLLDGKPAWTLVFAGPRTHEPWGYMTETGWVDHVTYRKMRHPEDT